MHDLASNTEVDSENHKMKVMLTPKFRWDVTNMCNRMLQAYVTVARWLTCLKKTCNILGFMEIIVYKIQPVGGWG